MRGGRITSVAREVFGLAELRPGQREAVQALAGGRDALVVMPTGSGKSAVYQIAGMMLGGPTVVVSPLVSLQRDQVQGLGADGVEAHSLNAATSAADRDRAFAALGGDRTAFVFMAPEQLVRPDVRETLARTPPRLVVVDEAHCVSAWGHDFRPDYLRVGAVVGALSPRPVTAALTATAAPPVRDEIVERLRLRDPAKLVHGFDRPEIRLAVRSFRDADEQRQAVLDTAHDLDGSGIVYVATRKDTAWFSRRLPSARPYHGGMRKRERDDAQQAFMTGRTRIIVATTAFGMGIDKPDVRFVLHAQVPDSLDSYYQQVGRAGRDGRDADALCFYHADDLGLPRFFTGGLPDEETLTAVCRAVADGVTGRGGLAERAGVSPRRLTALLNLLQEAGAVRLGRRIRPAPQAADIEETVAATVRLAQRHRDVARTRIEMMRRYCELTDCRGRFLLRYFGEARDRPCGHCDTCESGRAEQRLDNRVFPVGVRVEHRKWGGGVVVAGERERVTILFDEAGYKELLVAAVAERGLLTRERSPR